MREVSTAIPSSSMMSPNEVHYEGYGRRSASWILGRTTVERAVIALENLLEKT
jgi:hypothetical protein